MANDYYIQKNQFKGPPAGVQTFSVENINLNKGLLRPIKPTQKTIENSMKV